MWISYRPNVFALVFFYFLLLLFFLPKPKINPLAKAPQIGQIQPAQAVALNVREDFLGLLEISHAISS